MLALLRTVIAKSGPLQHNDTALRRAVNDKSLEFVCLLLDLKCHGELDGKVSLKPPRGRVCWRARVGLHTATDRQWHSLARALRDSTRRLGPSCRGDVCRSTTKPCALRYQTATTRWRKRSSRLECRSKASRSFMRSTAGILSWNWCGFSLTTERTRTP